MFFFNVFNYGSELCLFRLVNEVCLVHTNHFAVRRNWNHCKVVGVHQFCGLCLGGSRHSSELVVHAEIVLQRNGGKSLILFLDLYALFGFNGLVDAFTPPTTFKNSTSELVNNFNFTILNDVVLVAVIQNCGLQCNLQLVHQVLLHFVVQIVDAELLLNLFNTGFGWNHYSLVFFYFVIDVS